MTAEAVLVIETMPDPQSNVEEKQSQQLKILFFINHRFIHFHVNSSRVILMIK